MWEGCRDLTRMTFPSPTGKLRFESRVGLFASSTKIEWSEHSSPPTSSATREQENSEEATGEEDYNRRASGHAATFPSPSQSRLPLPSHALLLLHLCHHNHRQPYPQKQRMNKKPRLQSKRFKHRGFPIPRQKVTAFSSHPRLNRVSKSRMLDKECGKGRGS